MRLTDRVAVVTGAASGIGDACVAAFLREGAKVAAIDRAFKPSERSAGRFQITCDVASQEAVAEAARTVREKLGAASILVNCAGISSPTKTLETPYALFRSVMDVNVWGAMNLCQAFAPSMIEQRSGSIINIASITGIVGAPGLSAYAASKGALITLTRTMALELAEYEIRVNCVCPASIETQMLQSSFDRMPDPEQARLLNIRRHPLGRLGTPEDVANFVLFLASDEALWITGGTHVVDGGAIIARRWKE